MIPKIKPEEFGNDLFTTKETKQDTTTIMFVDFQYSSSTPISTSSPSSYPMTIGPNVFQKNVKLDTLSIKYKNFNINKLKEEINKEFYKIVTDLGKQHRETAPAKRFDINVREIKKKGLDVGRKIISTINSTSSYIAVEGRIGPAQWMISNSKTYNYIFNYLSHLNLMNINNQLIGNIHYMVDEAIEDDILLLGRKNSIDLPGVHCLVLTNDDGNILFNKINSPEFEYNTIQIYFKITDIGFHPYTQYMVINTRDIQYYRNLKLKRIKEIYGG